MMKRIIFVIMFTVVHAVTTMIVWANAIGSSCLIQLPRAACKAVGIVLACPVLLPCIMMDPDGDRFPKWFQISSFFANSLVWAGLILLLIRVITHFRNKRQSKETPNQSIQSIGSCAPNPDA